MNTIIKCGTWHRVKVQLVSRSWNEMTFIVSLMLPTLIQGYDKKKSFHFWSSSKKRDEMKFYRLPEATFYDCINTIYQFIKPFVEKTNVYFWGIWSLQEQLWTYVQETPDLRRSHLGRSWLSTNDTHTPLGRYYTDLHLSRNVRKRTFVHMCLGSIQTILRFRTVWSESFQAF